MSQPSDKRKILFQFDSDAHPSAFDRVVAIDAGVDELFSYGQVSLDQIQGLVHGAIFTRGPQDLKRTAIFIGGSGVGAGEEMMARILETFIGPLRVSVMMDSNGSNTTAAAAVISARKHLDLALTSALVLGTGPVGVRAARLLAREGSKVYLSSRSVQRAKGAADAINQAIPGQFVMPVGSDNPQRLAEIYPMVQLLIAAGPAGVQMIDRAALSPMKNVKVLIDLNAVPPLGIEGVGVMDKAKEIDGRIAYGAIGVGGTKMKIHKAAIANLFEANDRVLDDEAIYALAKTL